MQSREKNEKRLAERADHAIPTIAPMCRRASSFSRPRIVQRRAASATAMSHQRFSLNLSTTAGPISEVMIIGVFWFSKSWFGEPLL